MKAKIKATGKIVDGIPIYYGSEGKGYLDVPVDHHIFDRYDLEEVELLEQPASEGLEEAAEKYRRDSCNTAMMPNIDGPMPEYGGSVKDAFIAGAEWMKAKMLEGAVEGKIAERVQGKLYARCQIPSTMGIEFGDKVRVIIIKEN